MLVHVGREMKEFVSGQFRRLRNSEDGNATIEFVMIVPILLLFMVGTFEVSRAINVDKRVNSVTAMAGDLISREGDLGGNPAATLDAIMGVVTHVMHPYDAADLRLSVIPVMADPADENKTFVYAPPYKYHSGVADTPSKNQCYSFSAGSHVMSKGASVIVVKAEYDYTPVFEGFFDNFNFMGVSGATWDDAATYSDLSIHSPRTGCVDFEGNNCVVSTPGGC